MSHFRTVLRHSSYLLGFKLLSRALSVVFLVYAAARLGPELFGALSFVLVTVELLAGVGDLGITRYGARELLRDWDRRAVLAGEILSLQALTSLLLAAAGLAIVVIYQPAYPKYELLLLGLAAFLSFSVIATTESIFTASQRFFYSALLTFLGRLVYVGIGIAALAAGQSVVVIMWGYVAAVMMEAGARFLVARRVAPFSFGFPAAALWRMLVATMPFAVVGIASIVSYRINLMILEFIRGDAAAGIYNVAFTLFSPFVWIGIILSTTAFPGFARIYARDREAARRNGWQWYRLVAIAGIPAALLVSLLSKSVLAYFPVGYAESASILIVLIWSLPPMLLSTIDVNILQVADRQNDVAHGQVMGAVVTALSSLALIPFLGGVGAALAALGAVVVMETYIHFQVRRHFMGRSALPLLVRPLLGGIVMAAAALGLIRFNVWLAALAGLLAYITVIFATGAVRLSEIKSLLRG